MLGASTSFLGGLATATSPWLATSDCHHSSRLLDRTKLHSLAALVENAPLSGLVQAKAFCSDNDADTFFSSGNDGLSWICFNEACASLSQQAFGRPDATIAEALARMQSPIAARVASRGRSNSYTLADDDETHSDEMAVAPELAEWLCNLDDATQRPYCDADIYCTAAASASASLGWHVDDVDVLLIMLKGRKRFRVAGRTFGSTVAIDAMLEAGDALFIPALTFHTGGGDERGGNGGGDDAAGGWGSWARGLLPSPTGAASAESWMLSVALPWADAAAQEGAQAAAAEWRDAIEGLAAGLPARCNSWSYAATPRGREEMATLLSDEAAARFLPLERS